MIMTILLMMIYIDHEI